MIGNYLEPGSMIGNDLEKGSAKGGLRAKPGHYNCFGLPKGLDQNKTTIIRNYAEICSPSTPTNRKLDVIVF